MNTTLARRLTASLLVIGLVLGSLATARAGEPDSETQTEAAGPTPLRLGFTAGEVHFWRPGTETWVPAQVNIPLAPGDQLATDRRGNIEIQTGPASFLRVWGDSRVALISHEDTALRFGVTSGYLGLDLRTVAPAERIHVATPHATVTVGQAGYYRIDVSVDRTAVSARRGGRATVTAHGHTVSVASDHRVLAGAASDKPLEPTTAPAIDTWDRWSIERTDTLLAAESARYVAPEVYGAADLDRHGTWREEPTYGPVWEPAGVSAGWVPYSTGTWMTDPVYGWTWVDAAPWGWAPYHYGRWVFVNDAWAWAPGPPVARPVYAPALVAFFGPPQPVGRPFVSWVALGWGEPLVPWWGRPGFVGRPSYAGWAGPRHWHRDRFHGRPSDYRNVHVRNAVVGMHRDRFGRDRVERARTESVDVSRLQPVRDPRPDRASGGRGGRSTATESERSRERPGNRPGSAERAERERASGRPERETSAERERTREHDDVSAERERRQQRETSADQDRPRERETPAEQDRPRNRETSADPDRARERDTSPEQDRPRERDASAERDRERPEERGTSAAQDRPRERPAAPTSTGRATRDEPRMRAVPPATEAGRPGVPRFDPAPRRTPSPQQWRRTGDDRTRGRVHRNRNAPAKAQRNPPARGRQ